MKIKKEVYPPLGKKHTLMFRAEKSLLEKMQTYLIQPNEWQFILQCAWIVGFKEGLEEKKESECTDCDPGCCTEDSGDMFPSPVGGKITVVNDGKEEGQEKGS